MGDSANSLIHTVDSLPLEEARHKVALYLKPRAEVMRDSPDQAMAAAYSIAGLLATDFAQSLADDDPLDIIMTIAGELEVDPPEADKLRRELIQAIDDL